MAGILRTDTIQNSNTSTIITQTNSTTITIGTTGQTIALASGATSSGFGATYNGAVNWDTTPKTTTVTAASGVGYFINTTSGAVTVNLPVGVVGATIALADYANTWQTNNVTVTPNGTEKIGGVAAPATLSVQGQSVTFTYVDSTQGWKNTQDSTSNVIGAAFISATGGTITTSGDYKIHTFTGPGTFAVSALASNPSNNTVEYLVVAGGAGGGNSLGGGGGGAGGFRTNFPSAGTPVTVTSYPITVGAGGGAAPSGACQASPSIFSTITSAGGGRGDARSGGSGGGGSHRDYPVGGAGNTPPVSPPQGQPGGATPLPAGYAGAGGGGHTQAGTDSSPAYGPISTQSGAPGGNGTSSSISGSAVFYAGGGGGGSFQQSGSTSGGTGGQGGGGLGAYAPGPSSSVPGTAGTANTGGGGGGGGYRGDGTTYYGGSGGSGVVIIRYRYQ
jgi:hypothetical protein